MKQANSETRKLPSRWEWHLEQALRFLNMSARRVEDREVRARVRELIVKVEDLLEGVPS